LDSSYGYFVDSGDPVSAALTKVNIAYYTMLQNNLDQANLHIESISDIMRQGNRNLRLMAHFALNVAELEFLNGEFAKAESLLQTAERYASQAPLLAIGHRSKVWQRALREGGPSVAGLEEIRVAAMDLRHRFLSWDANVIGLLGLVYAERLNSPYSARELITDEFHNMSEFEMLKGHFGRILDVLDRHPSTLPTQPFPKFLSRSPAILRLKEGLKKLLDTDVRLLLEGESGTGKTFLARQLHEASKHRTGPFITVDCTNLEESLFESKLFGHLRGSFTGAVSDTVGLVEQANGGTLFLDEIGELPTEIQGKLLYTIEEQRYRPVGAKSEKHSDFRVIAATNRDIDAMLLGGTLRTDLFFRMAGFRVHLPPLRSRREDIAPLAEHRLAQLNSNYGRRKHLRAEVWEALLLYNWPGNVRELSTALERGYHLSSGRRISLDDLGLGLSTNSLDRSDLSWYAIRREHLLKVLRLTRGNVTRAAQLLGLNRTTLIYKLKLLSIDRKDYDSRYIK
jgi:DNA-binding NtrC family response regulator